MKKRLVCFGLALVFVLGLVPAAAFGADVIASGDCGAQGNNLTWTLDGEGLLTIKGSGEMKDYSYEETAPWKPYHYSDIIAAVAVEQGVTRIGDNAFAGCTDIRSVQLPAGLLSIGEDAFEYCSELPAIDIPESVTEIGNGAFSGCYDLTEVTVPDGVTVIGEKTFADCRKLTDVRLPAGLTAIGDNAFSHCFALPEIQIPDGVVSIGAYAFQYCEGLTGITLPDSVTTLGQEAFYSCKAMTYAKLSNRLTGIGYRTFCWCESLEEITIPGSVAEIGEDAFLDCYGLTRAVISDGVRTVGSGAFARTALTRITIPRSVTALGDTFLTCDNLEAITVAAGNPSYTSQNGVLFDQSRTTLLCYPAAKTDTRYAIPSTVTRIESYAFSDNKALVSVAIPDSVTQLGNGAFYGCAGLVNLSIPGSITEVPFQAFCDCNSLESVTLGEGITTLGQYSFYGSSWIRSVVVPSSLTLVDTGAFGYCSLIEDVYYAAGYDQWERIYIDGTTGSSSSNRHFYEATLHPFMSKAASDRYAPVATVEYGGHRYSLYHVRADFQEAADFCTSRSGYLAAITSPGEENYLEKNLLDKHMVDECWIGLGSVNNLYTWINGEGSPVYTKWLSGQPKAQETGGTEIAWYNGYGWSTAEAGKMGEYFLCEWEGTDISVVFHHNYTDSFLGEERTETLKVTSEEVGSPLSYVPINPTRFGYKFKGWYTNSSCTGTPWNTKSEGVVEPLNLYAKWVPEGFDFDENTVRYGNDSDTFYDTHVFDYVPVSLYYRVAEDRVDSGPSLASFLASLSPVTQAVEVVKQMYDFLSLGTIVSSAVQKSGKGLCFGTCVMMALDYNGYIDREYLGCNRLTDMTAPDKNSRQMELICSLFVTQRSKAVWENAMCTKEGITQNMLHGQKKYKEKELWDKTFELLADRQPVLLTLYYSDGKGHHEVLAYDYEKRGDGGYRVQIANPNWLGGVGLRTYYELSKDYKIEGEFTTDGDFDMTNGPLPKLMGIIYDFTPFTKFGITAVRTTPFQLRDDMFTQSAEDAGTWLQVSCPDFTIASDAGTETVAGFELREDSALIREDEADESGLYALPDSESGYTFTPEATGREIRAAFLTCAQDGELVEVGLETTASGQLSAVLDGDGALTVSGAAEPVTVFGARWGGLPAVEDTVTPCATLSAADVTIRADYGKLTITAPEGTSLGKVTAVARGVWKEEEKSVTVQGNTLEIVCDTGELILTYDGQDQSIPRLHNVIYDTDGGSFIAPVTGLADGDPIPLPKDDPVRPGYRFDGWSCGEGDVIQGEDVTVTAFWEECDDLEVRFTNGKETQLFQVEYNAWFPESAVPAAESFGQEELAWDQAALDSLLSEPVTEDITVMGSVTPKSDGTEAAIEAVDLTAGAVVRNLSQQNLAMTLAAAYYDENGRMLQTETKALILTAGETRIVSLKAPEKAASVKVMLLRSGDFVPLCAAGSDPGPAAS